MTAFAAVWAGVISVAFAIINLAWVSFEWRLLVMQIWGVVDAIPATLGILVLWSYRKVDHHDPGVVAQRLQAWVAVWLAVLALAINCAYLLWYYLTHVPAPAKS